MKRVRLISKLPLLAILCWPLLSATDLSTYRGFQLGMNLNAAVKLSGTDISEVTTIRQRPACIQELSWNPQRLSADAENSDPVRQVLFSFYDGQLFRMVVSYDNEKTEGMSVADFVSVLSGAYGTSVRPAVATVLPSDSYSEGMSVVARWEDADYSLNLVQSPYGLRFGLIAFSKHLDASAQAAIAAGIQLDEREAPQRQLLKEQNAQSALEQIRLVNKAHFRP